MSLNGTSTSDLMPPTIALPSIAVAHRCGATVMFQRSVVAEAAGSACRPTAGAITPGTAVPAIATISAALVLYMMAPCSDPRPVIRFGP
jgi:hypothetical protein